MTKPVSRSELSRLGKRGSYRLGLLAPQGIAAAPPPKAFRPSFARERRAGSTTGWVLAMGAGIALVAVAAVAGLWFVPLIVGVITGLAARWGAWRLRATAPAVIVMCAAGWGAALCWYSARGLPIGASARAMAAIAGLPAYAAVAVAITLAVSVVLGLVGLWLGRALTPRPPR
ncbi:MAG TPA: hypothetical protein VMR14_19275 [Streptosporangiaceae bacterium]|jgi:hypothetical protein|nr:hypothetical protein [Streptosporangiaceae bacterium]